MTRTRTRTEKQDTCPLLETVIETHIAHILLHPNFQYTSASLLAIIESTATTEVQFTKVLLHFKCNLTLYICSAD